MPGFDRNHLRTTLSHPPHQLKWIDEVLLRLLVYSFMGWVVETGFVLISQHRLPHRGLINYGLPLIPLYGFAALLLVGILSLLMQHPVLQYGCAVGLTTVVEYLTSLLDTYFFHTSTWDYSSLPFSFQGRIALPISLGWGVLALVSVRLFNPWLDRRLKRIRVVPTFLIAGVFVAYALFASIKLAFG